MERCDTCILPKSNRVVDFDGSTCRLCAQGTPSNPVRVSTGGLEQLMQQVRDAGRGGSFDCVVGISGGRDSTYLLHQLVRRHGLRCIAAYYRTPYTPDVIDGNVRRASERLGVRLVEMEISRAHHNEWARRAVELWLKQPTPVHANLACAPCKQVNREALKIARRFKVRYLAMGSNRFESVQLAAANNPDVLTKGISRTTKTLWYLRLVRKGALALASSRELWRFLPGGALAVANITHDAPLLRFLYPEVIPFSYFYYAVWDEAGAQAALDELGWELPPGVVSPWRADCDFAEVKDRMFARMTGMTYVDAFFSNRVREGDLTRDQALLRIQTEGQPSAVRLRAACRVLGIPESTFS